jgi:hypothetical protein
MDYVKVLEELITKKRCQISDGVFLSCGHEVNLRIFNDDGEVKISVGSPSLNVEIHKMGMITLSKMLRPTIESVTITKDAYIISVDNAPDIEVKRDTSNS